MKSYLIVYVVKCVGKESVKNDSSLTPITCLQDIRALESELAEKERISIARQTGYQPEDVPAIQITITNFRKFDEL